MHITLGAGDEVLTSQSLLLASARVTATLTSAAETHRACGTAGCVLSGSGLSSLSAVCASHLCG